MAYLTGSRLWQKALFSCLLPLNKDSVKSGKVLCLCFQAPCTRVTTPQGICQGEGASPALHIPPSWCLLLGLNPDPGPSARFDKRLKNEMDSPEKLEKNNLVGRFLLPL